MTKADAAFFHSKREWSKRKDTLLTKYLPNYLPKVVQGIKKPVYVVDGFAGPGLFDDGAEGSPVLIARKIESALRALPATTAIRALFVESDPELFRRLSANTAQFPFVACRPGRFLDHVPEIAALARVNTVFLYLDPYTVEGLDWSALDRVFSPVRENRQSVELLLNLNAESFARRGLAALALAIPRPDPAEEDVDELDPVDFDRIPTIDHLNSMVGGNWWRPILADKERTFPTKVEAIRDGVCALLRVHFNEVCAHDVKAEYWHKVPKYSLLFASRTPIALMLMNDAMVESRKLVVEQTQAEAAESLFEPRPTTVVPDEKELHSLLTALAPIEPGKIPRKELMLRVVRQRIGLWAKSEMGTAVKTLLQIGSLRSDTKNSVTNEDTGIWRPGRKAPESRPLGVWK